MTAYMKLKSGVGIGELDDYRCAPQVGDLFFMVREGRAETEGLNARVPKEKAAERQRRLKDSSNIHFMLQCLSLVWTVSSKGKG